MKEQDNWDKGVSNKLKKRHRKDLSADEIQAIVAASREPFCSLKDVAQRYRLTPNLVGRLVKESETKPEAINELREREQLKRQKRDAIEVAVAKKRDHVVRLHARSHDGPGQPPQRGLR